MPTQTFWNLPADKRESLITIAVEEFANNDYDNASISRIVSSAVIAKGSIFQYFTDKKDLFLFLLELSNRKRLEYVQNEPPPEPNMSFWQMLRWQIGASTRAALAFPLLTQVYLRAMNGRLPFEEEMFGNMRSLALDHWRKSVQAGMTQGDLDSRVDPHLAAMMLNAVFNEIGNYVMQRLNIEAGTLHELDVTVFQTPEVERIFDDTIRLLERGLGRSA